MRVTVRDFEASWAGVAAFPIMALASCMNRNGIDRSTCSTVCMLGHVHHSLGSCMDSMGIGIGVVSAMQTGHFAPDSKLELYIAGDKVQSHVHGSYEYTGATGMNSDPNIQH